MTSLVVADGISKSLGDRDVLNDVSLRVQSGTAVAITGRNGAGKSVLFRILSGLMIPDKGRVVYDHAVQGSFSEFPEHVGVIIDSPGFIAHKSGFDNLKMLAGIRGAIDDSVVSAWMTRLGLDPDLRRPVSKYSTGMKQKVGLVQAFMEAPKLLILDEPFNGLDERSVASVVTLLSDFKGSGGGIIFSSHNAEDVSALADTVCELRDGVLHGG